MRPRKHWAHVRRGVGSCEASAQRWSRAFWVRAALVSSGGVPPSLPGTPAGWLPGAKRADSSIGRGATSVHQNGALTVQNITGLGLAVFCFIGIMGNSHIEREEEQSARSG